MNVFLCFVWASGKFWVIAKVITIVHISVIKDLNKLLNLCITFAMLILGKWDFVMCLNKVSFAHLIFQLRLNLFDQKYSKNSNTVKF